MSYLALLTINEGAGEQGATNQPSPPELLLGCEERKDVRERGPTFLESDSGL